MRNGQRQLRMTGSAAPMLALHAADAAVLATTCELGRGEDQENTGEFRRKLQLDAQVEGEGHETQGKFRNALLPRLGTFRNSLHN